MSDNKNMILAVGLSLAVLLLFQVFYEGPRQRERMAEQQQQALLNPAPAPTLAPAPEQTSASAPQTPTPVSAVTPALPRDEVLAEQAKAGNRVDINTPRLKGSITTNGGRFDDLTLVTYRETPDPGSPQIVLLAPKGTAFPYYADFGWIADDHTVLVPDGDTHWTVSGGPLDPDHPLVMTWANGQGLDFMRTVAVDANYMFTVTQEVKSSLDHMVSLYPYGSITRQGTPAASGNSSVKIQHEGGVGVLGGVLKEFTYADMKKDAAQMLPSTGGWLGITDKYWLVALAPDPSADIAARFTHSMVGDTDLYQTDYRHQALKLEPGQTASVTDHLFAGAKEVHLLDAYEKNLGILHFDKAVDFGRLYFLTKPFFYAIDFFRQLLGNFGLAILTFTVMLRLALFPLANKSFRSMSKMKILQPKIAELKEKCGNDKAKLSTELMELYRRENANPLSGCLPVVVQIPIFFALYKVLYTTIEMRHAPFFWWIKDLSVEDPTNIFNLFGLIPVTLPSMLHLGVLPLIMGATMFIQQKLNPPPADPTQAKVMMLMPVIFTFTMARFPAGLMLYWAWNNSLSILQQWIIMRGVERSAAKDAAKAA